MKLETHPAVQREVLRICREYGVTFFVTPHSLVFKGGTPAARAQAKDETDKFIHDLLAKIEEVKKEGTNESKG